VLLDEYSKAHGDTTERMAFERFLTGRAGDLESPHAAPRENRSRRRPRDGLAGRIGRQGMLHSLRWLEAERTLAPG